ncbi:DUF2939 domain-containing protein [Aurantiacibacter gilvus]|uniref:DUF2939 domain-containing protein n=1 Tax=Aurantiacibacter gilvus TaxID=3139141 RepID=A0ABU9IBS8_9SPHN
MKKLPLLLAILFLTAIGWYFVSPWLAMKGVADAAMDGDTATLEERIDFDAMRASAREQLSDAVAAEQGRGGLLDVVGGVVAERVGREAIDRAITPTGVANIVRYGAPVVPLVPERYRSQEISWDVQREGLNSFRAFGTYEDGTPGPNLTFSRDGLGWTMTVFELPQF